MNDKQKDRREFLKAMGVVVPASIVAAPPVIGLPQEMISPRDIFEMYVAECLRIMPQYTGHLYPGGLSTQTSSVLRSLIEVQGAALATVLAELQHREAPG